MPQFIAETEEYILIYDRLVKELVGSYKTEKLEEYYSQVKQEFIETTQEINSNNCLTNIRKLFLLDAKFQILFFFWKEEDKLYFTEENIIAMVEKDYKDYYRQIMKDLRNKDNPLPFFFMPN